MRNQPPSGSIWVACASSALSRISKKSPHGTWVEMLRSGRANSSQRLSQSPYGDSRPRASSASCSATVRGLLKPWL